MYSLFQAAWNYKEFRNFAKTQGPFPDLRGGDLADITPFILQAEAANLRFLVDTRRREWLHRTDVGCLHAIATKTGMPLAAAEVLVEEWKITNAAILVDLQRMITASPGANYFL